MAGKREREKIGLVLLACITLVSCATRVQTEGTAAGAVGGALVGGPVGAVVGGVVGAVATEAGGALDRGRCYVRGYGGHILHHSDGRPRIRPC
jgi:outer membrane lipoprotein SlyB